jgi:hypothetical protein
MDRTLKEDPNKICFIDFQYRFHFLQILEVSDLFELIQNKYKKRKKLLCYWANIGPRPRCYRTTTRKLSRPSQPGGPVPLWALGYQCRHGRACERTPRRLPSGQRLKSDEPEVLGSGGSGHGGHRRRGGPIGGNREGNDSPQQRLHNDARRVGRSVGEGPEE